MVWSRRRCASLFVISGTARRSIPTSISCCWALPSSESPDARLASYGHHQDWCGGQRILDQLRLAYPANAPLLPAPQEDPGRVRNRAFFDKMYGDCKSGQVAPGLVHVIWLPDTWGHAVSITSVNGVDRQLAAVSRELDALPSDDKRYLYPVGGTYACRSVADTGQTSMHAWGAAIDINPALSDYWLWRRTAGLVPAYVNRIPSDVVAVFERHGFIWGGRWRHFDTMHFEYRLELLLSPQRHAP
jgi:D-alanyl-D-alanine carboxypeptidase